MKLARFAAMLVFAPCGLAPVALCAQTDVISNGSFETGLTGWSQAPSDQNAGGTNTGKCGFNGAVAPGTETLTNTTGLAATNGTHTALGSVHVLSGSRYACVLYQDVAIPAGATTASFSADIGSIFIDGMSSSTAAIQIGLFAVGSVPADTLGGGGASLLNSALYYQPGSGATDSHLNTVSKNNLDVHTLAGTTVRFAIILVTVDPAGSLVGVVDNVHLLVTAPAAAPPVPALGGWPAIALVFLLGGTAYLELRRAPQTATIESIGSRSATPSPLAGSRHAGSPPQTYR